MTHPQSYKTLYIKVLQKHHFLSGEVRKKTYLCKKRYAAGQCAAFSGSAAVRHVSRHAFNNQGYLWVRNAGKSCRQAAPAMYNNIKR